MSMLYDEPQIGAVVDGEAALEFMKEATKLATATELETIGARLADKSARFRERLGHDRIASLDADGFTEIVSQIFSIRRKAGRLIKINGIDTLRGELQALLHGTDRLATRIDRFTARITGLERAMIVALATESLHFTDPERYWLWTHWIWNPDTKTGALRLVTHDAAQLVPEARSESGPLHLGADSDGVTYERVGWATNLLDQHGHVAGYARAARGLFGTDIFLACVYAVYMATMFRLTSRMTTYRAFTVARSSAARTLLVRALTHA